MVRLNNRSAGLANDAQQRRYASRLHTQHLACFRWGECTFAHAPRNEMQERGPQTMPANDVIAWPGTFFPALTLGVAASEPLRLKLARQCPPRLVGEQARPQQTVGDHRAAHIPLFGKFTNALRRRFNSGRKIDPYERKFVGWQQKTARNVVAKFLDLRVCARCRLGVGSWRLPGPTSHSRL